MGFIKYLENNKCFGKQISELIKIKSNFLLKYSFIEIYLKNYYFKIILFIVLFYIRYLYFVKDKIIVDADNKLNLTLYENNTNFSNFNLSDIKAIALYFPVFQSINNENKQINEWENIKMAQPLYDGHHQPRAPDQTEINLGYYDSADPETIKKQIELAKSHGIYGFGIYYYWFSGKILFQKTINLFLEDKDINFPFFLIWKNENFEIKSNRTKIDILIEQEYRDKDPEYFINDIKKFLISKNYIKVNKKPVLGIFNPFEFTDLKKLIYRLREKAREIEIGEIFLIAALSKPKTTSDLSPFNAAYEIPPKHFFKYKLMENHNFYYYSGLIYRRKNGLNNKNINNINNFPIYKCNMLEFDNSPQNNKSLIFDEYTPEKFYMINKQIIDWTKNNFNSDNRFIFINGWNNWAEGSYLEPDQNFGFASLNALSKALFNIPYRKMKYNLGNLTTVSKIVIQAHVYYEDLIKDVVNYTNNIPVKFDLFISTNSPKKKNVIERYVRDKSKAIYFQINVTDNRGRDILPMLIQLKNKIRNYKYFCHIHTKKSKTNPKVGENWRNYLYKNLLGSTKIISEILTNFENYDNLGIIYPDNYYELIEMSLFLSDTTKGYMNYIIKKIFPGHQVGKVLNFPAGDMFWAKVDAIHQIFEKKFSKKFSIEAAQVGDTFAHGIERIWVYVSKLNNYYYKTVFYDI